MIMTDSDSELEPALNSDNEPEATLNFDSEPEPMLNSDSEPESTWYSVSKPKPTLKTPVSPLDDAFPEIILGKIFRCLPSDSLHHICRTSERWAKIVDRCTGRVLIVKDGKDFIVDYESLFDKLSIKGNFWLSLARDNPLKLEDEDDNEHEKAPITSTLPDGDKDCFNFPHVANPDSVRKIGFVGQLGPYSSKILDSVFTSCQYVTGLYLHFSVFVTLYDGLEEEWNASGMTPYLKELGIDCCGTGSGDTDQVFNYKHAYCALYVFVSHQMFYLLEKFIFAVPYIELWEGPIVFALSGFLGRHSGTLKSFSFNQKYEICDDEYKESDGKGKGTEKGAPEKVNVLGEGDCASLYERLPPKDVNYLSLKQLAENTKVLKKVSLEEFHIVLIRPQESSPLWKNLMIQQKNFKKLIFVGDKIPCPSTTMEVNSSTLVTIRLDVRDVVNLECFRKCVCLKYLTLRGKQDNCGDSDSEDNEESHERQSYTPPAQLKNAMLLPHTLECVELINLRTDKDDLAIISVVLPYLRDLTLINLGWEGRLGLRLSHLALIWEKQQLDHFCIKASLNMMSYSELENDPRYPMNLLGCVIQSNSFATASRFSLEVWKNGKGHYTICKNESHNLDDDDIDVFQIPNRNQALLNDEEEESEYDDSESGTETSGEESVEEENEKWEDCEDGESTNVEEENEKD